MQLAVNFLEPNSRTLNFEFSPSFFFFVPPPILPFYTDVLRLVLFRRPHYIILLLYYSPFCRVFIEIFIPCENYTLKKNKIKSGVPTFNNSHFVIYTYYINVSLVCDTLCGPVKKDVNANKIYFIGGWW